MPVMAMLPQYQSHKKVWALKIVKVEDMGDGKGAYLHFEAERHTDFSPVVVDQAWQDKHNPQPGGYWVQYEDGYTSYSPAEAFESGYTRI